MIKRSTLILVIAALLLNSQFALSDEKVIAKSEIGTEQAITAYRDADFLTAINAAKNGADQEDITAQYILGSSYANSKKDARNLTKAEEWLRRCADKGVVAAMRDLGHFFLLYKGDPSKWDEAIYWYTKAASQGDYEAQQVLGILHVRAIAKPIEAYKWLTLASGSPDKDSRRLTQAVLDRLAKALPDAAIKEAKTRASRWQPAHALAATTLGDLRSAKIERAHMGTTQQLRFGRAAGDLLGLDPAFGALIYPSGGLIGKGAY